ncbi:MAG: GreA/GreB family elongation factor [Kiritimatiellia bacterium]
MIDAAARRSRDETENWLLEVLDQKPLPLDDIFDALTHHGSAGFDRRVDGWAELLQESLIQGSDRDGLLRLLALRCNWRPDSQDFTPACKSAVEQVFTTRLEKALIKNAGFENQPAAEAIRRLQVLALLHKGTLCREKTWGFGVVQRVDDFYGRVTIDFDSKRGHEMALSYAAEKVEILPVDHILVRLHEDRDGLLALADADPAAVVRLALSSFGPLTGDELQARLVGTVLDEKQWKDFWGLARKQLKSDPHVFLPPKRTEPIQLLASAAGHLDAQFDLLGGMRVPAEILKKLDELEAAKLLSEAKESHLQIVGDRLAFAVWGTGEKEPVLMARAILTAERLDLCRGWAEHASRPVKPEEVYRHLSKPVPLRAVLAQLPARMLGAFLDRVFALHLDLLLLHLPDILRELPVGVLPEVADRLAASGNAKVVCDVIASRLAAKSAGPALVYWLLKEPRDSQWRRDLDGTELLWQGLDVLARPAAGDMLRAQHLVRALFEDAKWLEEEMGFLRSEQREVFLLKLLQASGWEESGRRAVVAIVVKAHPELAEVMKRDSDKPQAAVRKRMTSWRSYRERQAQFRKLMEDEIPENAREIAVARSYGDLRENAEYKYAKEHQRILYLRRDEMERDLEVVQGTDFAGFVTDSVGMGTVVTIARPDERTERYCVLGEWDRDAGLGIISSLSRLAQVLEGHVAGDTVRLPGETSDEPCRILSVEALGDAEKAWLDAT